MFKLRRSNEIDEFAASLAREFSARVPPGKEPNAKALARTIDDTCNRAKAFQREKDLGFYGRAKFGTAFKLELKSAGYAADFVDHLTRQVLFILSAK
jgi:hypothetical protein